MEERAALHYLYRCRRAEQSRPTLSSPLRKTHYLKGTKELEVSSEQPFLRASIVVHSYAARWGFTPKVPETPIGSSHRNNQTTIHLPEEESAQELSPKKTGFACRWARAPLLRSFLLLPPFVGLFRFGERWKDRNWKGEGRKHSPSFLPFPSNPSQMCGLKDHKQKRGKGVQKRRTSTFFPSFSFLQLQRLA